MLALLVASGSCTDVVKTFSSENGAGPGRFNHLAVDKNTGRVFVGAVNQLYQLSPVSEKNSAP